MRKQLKLRQKNTPLSKNHLLKEPPNRRFYRKKDDNPFGLKIKNNKLDYCGKELLSKVTRFLKITWSFGQKMIELYAMHEFLIKFFG
jgi:hypothetical protein